jgi:hypothetical protein
MASWAWASACSWLRGAEPAGSKGGGGFFRRTEGEGAQAAWAPASVHLSRPAGQHAGLALLYALLPKLSGHSTVDCRAGVCNRRLKDMVWPAVLPAQQPLTYSVTQQADVHHDLVSMPGEVVLAMLATHLCMGCQERLLHRAERGSHQSIRVAGAAAACMPALSKSIKNAQDAPAWL